MQAQPKFTVQRKPKGCLMVKIDEDETPRGNQSRETHMRNPDPAFH